MINKLQTHQSVPELNRNRADRPDSGSVPVPIAMSKSV